MKETNMPPVRRYCDPRFYDLAAVGGLFKTEAFVKPNGRRIALAVPGSGGCTCYNSIKRAAFGPSQLAVNPCTIG